MLISVYPVVNKSIFMISVPRNVVWNWEILLGLPGQHQMQQDWFYEQPRRSYCNRNNCTTRKVRKTNKIWCYAGTQPYLILMFVLLICQDLDKIANVIWWHCFSEFSWNAILYNYNGWKTISFPIEVSWKLRFNREILSPFINFVRLLSEFLCCWDVWMLPLFIVLAKHELKF